MFRFRTNHQPPRERRDGFGSFRCFLWLGGRGGEKNRRRTDDFERMERDFEEEEKGTLRRRNQDFEEGKKGNRESCDSIAVFW